MARGWESKDVEAQVVESAEPKKGPSGRVEKSPQQQLREQGIRDLQLSKTPITNDLSNATTPHTHSKPHHPQSPHPPTPNQKKKTPKLAYPPFPPTKNTKKKPPPNPKNSFT